MLVFKDYKNNLAKIWLSIHKVLRILIIIWIVIIWIVIVIIKIQ